MKGTANRNCRADVDLALVFLTFLLVTVLLVAYGVSQRNSANIDSALKAEPNHLDWGEVYKGAHYIKAVNLTNTSTSATAPLNMTHDAPEYLRFGWDAENKTIPANSTLKVGFYIRPTWNATAGSFSFTIIVRG